MNHASLKAVSLALVKRQGAINSFKEEKTDCYRLLNGAGEGVPGLVVEKYGELLVFQIFEGKCELDIEQLKFLSEFYGKEIGIQSVYLKNFVTDRSSQTADFSYYLNHPLWGGESPSKIVCCEKGMKFEIHPYEGFSTGIFLDQRNNREFFRRNFTGQKVLNCFSYTCAFSVAAALGESHVTSIDLSKKYLDWGRINFELNGLKPQDHLFYATDVFDHFKKAKKLGKSYDLIILDPPSFSRNNQGKVFSVKKDMENLIAESFELLNKSGVLFVSTNLASWTSQTLKQWVMKVVGEKRIKIEWCPLPEQPQDFLGSESPLSNCCVIKKS